MTFERTLYLRDDDNDEFGDSGSYSDSLEEDYEEEEEEEEEEAELPTTSVLAVEEEEEEPIPAPPAAPAPAAKKPPAKKAVALRKACRITLGFLSLHLIKTDRLCIGRSTELVISFNGLDFGFLNEGIPLLASRAAASPLVLPVAAFLAVPKKFGFTHSNLSK